MCKKLGILTPILETIKEVINKNIIIWESKRHNTASKIPCPDNKDHATRTSIIYVCKKVKKVYLFICWNALKKFRHTAFRDAIGIISESILIKSTLFPKNIAASDFENSNNRSDPVMLVNKRIATTE